MIARLINRILRPFGVQLLRTGASSGVNARRVKASIAVFDALDHTVQAGPFEGTRIAPRFAWGNASIGAVVLGCYEEQLHPIIEELIDGAPDLIVNIGSAEGTYAVGLARRVQDARIVAVDIEPDAIEAVRENGALNGIEGRIDTRCGIESSELNSLLAAAKRPAVVIDCEGCEKEYIDLGRVPALAGSVILVEVHERLVPGIGDLLRHRLASTHHITEIFESGRNPHQYEVLRSMHSIDKWLAVCEGRDETMSWFWCRPLDARPS